MWKSLLIVLPLILVDSAQGISLYDLIAGKPELSKFLRILDQDGVTRALIQGDETTAFVPTNEALENYEGVRDYRFLRYHLLNLALMSQDLETKSQVTARLKGNPVLWITVSKDKEYFINNAKIIKKDIKGESTQGNQRQVLHIIDRVLEPILPTADDSSYYNPNAAKLLQSSTRYELGTNQITKFYQRVRQMEKEGVFSSTGGHTYFIPVNDNFDETRDKVDGKIIDAHIIPNKVLFSRTMGEKPYETMAFEDMIKVTISLRKEPHPTEVGKTFYDIRSTTIVGDQVHPTGSVLVRLVKANIPVANGVVHLVKRPLMVTWRTITAFLQDGKNDRFYEFYRLLQDHGANFFNDIISMTTGTLFVPSNKAFADADRQRLDAIISDQEKLDALLELHFLTEKVSTEDVRLGQPNQLFQVQTKNPNRKLYFSVIGTQGNQSLTVEGGGTNATVIVPDLGVADGKGIIHVIDKILGIPYRTLYQKLSIDPMMSDTFHLGEQNRFNQQMNNHDKKFTYFVPSNMAWDYIKRENPSGYKKLFMGDFPYNARQILERHLIVNDALSIEELMKRKSRTGGTLRTVRGEVKLTVEASTLQDYYVEWEGKRMAQIIRPNVECTNGYIHIIDRVLMQPRDIVVGEAAIPLTSLLALITNLLLVVLLG